jgi:acetyltransferase-like isoleucine patch superfamily enzyme
MQTELDDETAKLYEQIVKLHHHLRANTKNNFQRMNPFNEDIFDWKERATFWCQEDKDITIYNSATLIGDVNIGEKTWIGPNCMLDGTGGLTIGRYCSIAQGCQLLSHDSILWALSGGKSKYEYASTKIGNCCFLGVNVVVIKGVSIGDHCLIAAGSIITKDVPAYSIMAGVPAKAIGKVHLENDEVKLEYF